MRRLLVQELPAIFDANRYAVEAAVDLQHPKAASAFGGSANGNVFMFQLEQLTQHIRPHSLSSPPPSTKCSTRPLLWACLRCCEAKRTSSAARSASGAPKTT